jgi:hypothetical protein
MGPNISMAGCFFYGGMSRDQAHTSLKLFSQHIIPEARAMHASFKQAKAA